MLVVTPLQQPQTCCVIWFSLPLLSAKYSLSPISLEPLESGPTTNNLSAFTSPIPWRKAGLSYDHNDIYFDIAKTLDAVVNSVLGKIDVNCRLSGTPDLLLTLINLHTISELSFHPCVWFIPT
ncbi:hypothetical protein H4582DRAFT_1983140 [Lactarius indigo]|nr:hypothetical protein H4582DRAFT_1983140 [Lactarius indigo]